MKLYNTETRAKEAVVPLDGKKLRYYTCGPTVYDFAHIGNFRTFVVEDLLKRTAHFFGIAVHHVMNLTDVDDKTIRGALKENTTLEAFTKKYADAFFEDLKTLNILPADQYPAATDYIPQMIAMMQQLVEEKVAYVGSDGSLYYSIAKFPKYGRLSRLKMEELQVGASERVLQDEYTKENASDFVLWKKHDPERDGSIFWQSPFGPGRPGWHSECSVMAQELLGKEIDIHAGGVDLTFPHHENEIAQAEVCSKRPFARLWVHVEHLLVEHKKMSKSLGNFFTLRDLIQKGYTGRQIRYLLLQTHYRLQMNFTFQALDGAKGALQRIDDFIARLQEYKTDNHAKVAISEDLLRSLDAFTAAIGDDLNTSEALSVVFELIRHINILCDENKVSSHDVEAVLSLLKKFDMVFGVLFTEKAAIPMRVLELVEERTQVRKEKNFKRSDEIRLELQQLGWVVEDTPQGPRVKSFS